MCKQRYEPYIRMIWSGLLSSSALTSFVCRSSDRSLSRDLDSLWTLNDDDKEHRIQVNSGSNNHKLNLIYQQHLASSTVWLCHSVGCLSVPFTVSVSLLPLPSLCVVPNPSVFQSAHLTASFAVCPLVTFHLCLEVANAPLTIQCWAREFIKNGSLTERLNKSQTFIGHKSFY